MICSFHVYLLFFSSNKKREKNKEFGTERKILFNFSTMDLYTTQHSVFVIINFFSPELYTQRVCEYVCVRNCIAA